MAPSPGNELPGYDHSIPTGQGALGPILCLGGFMIGIVSSDENSRNSVVFGGQQPMKFETADRGHHYIDDQTGGAANLMVVNR